VVPYWLPAADGESGWIQQTAADNGRPVPFESEFRVRFRTAARTVDNDSR